MGDAGLGALGWTGNRGSGERAEPHLSSPSSPNSRAPVKVSAPLRALGGQREALLCRGKAILNNSSVAQKGEKPMGYGIALALNYTVEG